MTDDGTIRLLVFGMLDVKSRLEQPHRQWVNNVMHSCGVSIKSWVTVYKVELEIRLQWVLSPRFSLCYWWLDLCIVRKGIWIKLRKRSCWIMNGSAHFLFFVYFIFSHSMLSIWLKWAYQHYMALVLPSIRPFVTLFIHTLKRFSTSKCLSRRTIKQC